MDSIMLLANQDCTEGGMVFEVGSLYAHLKQGPDPRKPKGVRYGLATLLLLILMAKMGGEDNPTGIYEWVKHRQESLVKLLKLTREQVPHHCTYRRVLQVMDAEFFEKVMSEYQCRRRPNEREIIISIDGKTLRGTIIRNKNRGVHLLAAYLPGSGLVLMQIAVENKENEITVAPKLLQSLDLKGSIVIGDAMHAQRHISAQIVQAGGNFIWTVKGNQAKTEWAIQKLFTQAAVNLKKGAPLPKDIQMAESKTSKGHGRIEKRRILVSQTLNDYLDWPYVAQVYRLERLVWHDHGKRKTRQVTYGLTSLTAQQASPCHLLNCTRKYWGIENGLHYRRDVTLREDATRATIGNSGHNLAVINNLVIAICLSNGHKNVARARRLFNAKPEIALETILHA
jgi:predicted transposase YbfD/YdcC